MQLDSGQFLLLLFLTWVFWRLLPRSAASAVLLVASIIFYAFSGIAHLGLMLVVAMINYGAVKALSAWEDSPRREAVFYLAVGFDTLLLIFYKWAVLFLHLPNAPDLFKTLFPPSPTLTLGFPLGLSFFTFQVISCVTDVYRRSYQWTEGTSAFFLYAFFFPQISAGPIPRAEPLVPQLAGPRRLESGNLEAGIVLFSYGLFKKLVVANRLLPYIQNVFAPDAQHRGTAALLR